MLNSYFVWEAVIQTTMADICVSSRNASRVREIGDKLIICLKWTKFSIFTVMVSVH